MKVINKYRIEKRKMLPKSTHSSPSNSRTVYLNPDFKKNSATHINPKFLKSVPTSSSIHVNPAFLDKVKKSSPNSSSTIQHIITKKTGDFQANKIITKSRTKIIREPMQQKSVYSTVSSPLVKIGLRKLVRASTVIKTTPPIQHVNTPKKISSGAKGKYKIDRRVRKKSLTGIKKNDFVSRYALCRGNQTLTPMKILMSRRRFIRKIASSNSISKSSTIGIPISVNRKLELLNINGVLYNSTRNKLQRKDSGSVKYSNQPSKSNGERMLIVRGHRFTLDKFGHRLTRIENSNEEKGSLKRIDIGGLTYIAKSNDVYVRTEIHKARNHLSLAKHKSINLLSRNLVKSNIPCPIFRKVGKCAAYERGKCPKVHDKIHVAICPKFLKGDCNNQNCFLSHQVCLSKMPVCKFFLQGCCIREDCPYLHKKLSDTAKICMDFLKGFCRLAEKCNKRHEFVCLDLETKGKCEKAKCSFCKKKSKNLTVKNNVAKANDSDKDRENISEINQELSSLTRYFIDESDANAEILKAKLTEGNEPVYKEHSGEENESNILRPKRPKLGDLPAFIPL